MVPITTGLGMTPARLEIVLQDLGWNPTRLAEQLGCQPKIVRRWLGWEPSPPAPIPSDVATWIDGLRRYYVQHPPPQTWKRYG